jgi:flagellar FliL protein
VEMHEPLIRDQLILLFTQKTEEDFATTEGKEAIRQDALLRVQQVLQQEEGQPLVSDLLFNNLVIQR